MVVSGLIVRLPAPYDEFEGRVTSVRHGEDGATLEVDFPPTRAPALPIRRAMDLYISGKVIKVYSPKAKVIAQIEMPAGVSNLTFGGEDGRTLFCTSRAGIFAIPMSVRDGSEPFAVSLDAGGGRR